MASFDPSTGYTEDWAAHDFVENAEYSSPPGVGVKRDGVTFKAKLDDATNTVARQDFDYDDTVTTAIVWPVDDAALKLLPGGTFRLTGSGDCYTITAATKNRFGVWSVNLEPQRNDGDPNA